MSDETKHSPLDAITALEAATFRLAQTVRELAAEHPELTMQRVSPSVSVSDLADRIDVRARLRVTAESTDDVLAWARKLGAEARRETTEGIQPFEWVETRGELNGVAVEVLGTRQLSDDEAAAWRAQQAQTGGDQ